MKSLKRLSGIVMISIAMLFAVTSCAQAQKKAETQEVKIKTFFHCPNGQALIQKELVKEPGVTAVVADLETKVVTVTFEKGKTDKDKLVAAIEKIGYKTEFTPDDKPINKACSHDQPNTEPAHQH